MGGDFLGLARGVAGRRPCADGGVEQVRLTHALDGTGEHDAHLGEERPAALETLGRVLRLEQRAARELAE